MPPQNPSAPTPVVPTGAKLPMLIPSKVALLSPTHFFLANSGACLPFTRTATTDTSTNRMMANVAVPPTNHLRMDLTDMISITVFILLLLENLINSFAFLSHSFQGPWIVRWAMACPFDGSQVPRIV